jgi:hypothetical protein
VCDKFVRNKLVNFFVLELGVLVLRVEINGAFKASETIVNCSICDSFLDDAISCQS